MQQRLQGQAFANELVDQSRLLRVKVLEPVNRRRILVGRRRWRRRAAVARLARPEHVRLKRPARVVGHQSFFVTVNVAAPRRPSLVVTTSSPLVPPYGTIVWIASGVQSTTGAGTSFSASVPGCSPKAVPVIRIDVCSGPLVGSSVNASAVGSLVGISVEVEAATSF